MERTAIVIGGGIAGLAASIALAQAGFDTHVYEQADDLREIGAGLSVWDNGLAALDCLGALEPVLSAASPIRRLVNADWRGRVLQRCSIGRLGRHVAIQRPELFDTLRRASPAAVHTARRLVGVDQDTGGITARFADGTEARAPLLVGADGLWSVVRSRLFPALQPRYAGHVAWRGIADFEHPRWPLGDALSIMGCAKHFAIEPLTGGRIFWYSTLNLPHDAPVPAPGFFKSELLAAFGDCHDPVPALIRATPEDRIIRNRIYDLPAPRAWVSSRIALVGDAAHAMRPNLGQGACQAIEDAVVLGACLSRHADIPAALRAYQRRRRRRARWVVFWSRQISLMEQVESPAAVAARDFWLRWLNPGIVNLPWFWTIVKFRAPEVRRGRDPNRTGTGAWGNP